MSDEAAREVAAATEAELEERLLQLLRGIDRPRG